MKPIIFDEPSHTYTNKQGKRYTSATTVLSKYKQPFDKQAVATAYAKKHGHTADYWIKEWEKISLAACEKGTNFHKGKENYLLACTNYYHVGVDRAVRDLNKVPDFNFDYTTLENGIYPELQLWDHDHGIAGTADIVVIDGDYFHIDDYKTNKEIKTESYYHWKEGYKMMKEPIDHLQDCNYIHYSLQLSLYAYMLERLTGKKAGNIRFTHHPPMKNDSTQVDPTGIPYKVEYLKAEIEAILYHRQLLNNIR